MFLISAASLCFFARGRKMTRALNEVREWSARTETFVRKRLLAQNIFQLKVYIPASVLSEFLFCRKVTSSSSRFFIVFFFFFFFNACFSCLRRALYKCQCCINGTWNLNVPCEMSLVHQYMYLLSCISLFLSFCLNVLPQLHTFWRRH